MARCSDHRGQGPRPGPVPRAPRGLLHPRAVVEGEEAENDSGGASIAPRARPRMRVAARGPLAHAPVAPSTCTRCRRPSAAAAQPSDSRALPSLASQARGCSPCACSHRRARLAAGRHTRAESGLGVGSCPRLARCELRGHGCLRAECVRLPDGRRARPHLVMQGRTTVPLSLVCMVVGSSVRLSACARSCLYSYWQDSCPGGGGARPSGRYID